MNEIGGPAEGTSDDECGLCPGGASSLITEAERWAANGDTHDNTRDRQVEVGSSGSPETSEGKCEAESSPSRRLGQGRVGVLAHRTRAPGESSA